MNHNSSNQTLPTNTSINVSTPANTSASPNHFQLYFTLNIVFAVITIIIGLLPRVPLFSSLFSLSQYTTIITGTLTQTFAILAIEQYFHSHHTVILQESPYLIALFIITTIAGVGTFSIVNFAPFILLAIYYNLIRTSYRQPSAASLLLQRFTQTSLIFGIITLAASVIPILIGYTFQNTPSAQGLSAILYLIYAPFYLLTRVEAMVPVLAGFGLLLQYRKLHLPNFTQNLTTLLISLAFVLSPVFISLAQHFFTSISHSSFHSPTSSIFSNYSQLITTTSLVTTSFTNSHKTHHSLLSIEKRCDIIEDI